MAAQESLRALIDRHSVDIAFAADQKPAVTPADFVDQLATAGINLKLARMDDVEDIEAAATHLVDALASTDQGESQSLINRAGRLLKPLAAMVDEYRLMV